MPVQPIPQPQLLDPHRVLDERRDDFTADEHKERAQILERNAVAVARIYEGH